MAATQQPIDSMLPPAHSPVEEMPQLGEAVDVSDTEEEPQVLVIEDPPQQKEQASEGEHNQAHPQASWVSAHLHAPMFKPQPHTVTLFNTVDHRAEPIPCDLAVLTIGELRILAHQLWGADVVNTELHYGGASLNDDAAKAIDVGISNRCMVLIQPRIPEADAVMPLPIDTAADSTTAAVQRAVGPMPPAVPLDDQWRLQQQQLLQYNMALQANQQAQMQLAAMSGMPMPTPLPAPTNVFQFPQQHQGHDAGHNSITNLPDGNSPPRTITRVVVVQHSPPPSQSADFRTPSHSFSPQQMQTSNVRTMHVTKARSSGQINVSAAAHDGDFSSFAMTNEGARALISALDAVADPTETIDQLLSEHNVAALAAHQHGSKVARAVARRANPEQCSRLLELMADSVVDVAESTSGSDVLVDIIDKCRDTRVITNFCMFAAPSMLNLCCSVNGRKVLLAAISHFPPASVAPLYEAMGSQLLNIATDQCGCITMQRVLDYTSDRDWKTQLQTQILDNAMYLITDPYGNYILQHCVKDDQFCSQAVGQQISGRIVDFACNKFSSNVVERCMQMGPEDMRDGLIEEVLDPQVLEVLMQDAYGNFVVQSSVDHAPANMIDRLREAVLPLVARSPYGYRIESKLQRRLKRHTGRRGRGDRTRELPYNPQSNGNRPALSSIQSINNQQVFSNGKNAMPWHADAGKQLPWNAAAVQAQTKSPPVQETASPQGWGDTPNGDVLPLAEMLMNDGPPPLRRIPQVIMQAPQMAMAP